MNKLVKEVNRDELITEYLQTFNGILKLTKRELDLLAVLVKLELEYKPKPRVNKNIANRENRKRMISETGITKDNLSRYIKSFKQRGILKAGPADDELCVNKALVPVIINDRIQLTIVLKIKA